MKASIIITTYQRSDFLIRAINSVLNQEYNNYEIIVVDDNGEDSLFQKNNETLLAKYISDNRIKYIVLKENLGACNARNQGAVHAQGEYLFFLDDDDEFLPDKLSQQIDFLDQNPVYAAHLSAMTRLDPKGKEIISIENIPRGENFVSFAINGNFFTPMMAIRRNIFLEVGGFSKIDRFQDQYFMNKLLALGNRVKMDPKPLYIMHEHNENRITNVSIGISLTALDILKDFKYSHREMFTSAQWNEIEFKYLQAKATIYFLGKKYINRMRAFSIYLKLFIKCPSKLLVLRMIRTLIPV